MQTEETTDTIRTEIEELQIQSDEERKMGVESRLKICTAMIHSGSAATTSSAGNPLSRPTSETLATMTERRRSMNVNSNPIHTDAQTGRSDHSDKVKESVNLPKHDSHYNKQRKELNETTCASEEDIAAETFDLTKESSPGSVRGQSVSPTGRAAVPCDTSSKPIHTGSSLKILAWTRVATMHKEDRKTLNLQTQKGKEHVLRNNKRRTSESSEETSIAVTEGDPNEERSRAARWKESLIKERTVETPRRRDSVGLADQVLRGLVEMNSNLAKRRRNSETHSCGRTSPQVDWQGTKEKSLHDVMTLEANTPSFESRNEEIVVSQKRCRRKLSADLELEGGHKRFKSNTRRSLTPTPKRLSEQAQSQASSDSEDEAKSLHPRKVRQQFEQCPVPMAPQNSDEVTTLVETTIGRLSPVLMSATTIAVAPLLKLYENLNESLRDQTTLVALLNLKIVKLEIDLMDMTAQVVETRRGNDISLTALRESLKATIEDKRLLAEVTKQALTLLQKDREYRADASVNRLPTKIQLNTETTHATIAKDSEVGSLTNEETSKLKSVPTRTKKNKNCCSEADLEMSILTRDSPEKINKTKDSSDEVSERNSKEKNNKKKEPIKDSGKVMKENTLKTPTKKKRPQERDLIEIVQIENDEGGSESEVLDDLRMSMKEKDAGQTTLNSKVNVITEKKNEVEWFDIFESRKSKGSTGQSVKSRSVDVKQSKHKMKSTNQQVQKNKNPRSSANFFRNIKALTITVNNTEPTDVTNKKRSTDSSEAGRTTATEEPAKSKTRQMETNEDEGKTKISLVIEEEAEDDENLLNMSTYSSRTEGDVEDDNATETADERELKTQQDKMKGVPTSTCKTPIEPEQEGATGQPGKRVFLWPATPKKTESTLKNKEPKEGNEKSFCTLEEKRARIIQQQKKMRCVVQVGYQAIH
ncbi:enolase-phosphatase E1-like [Ambystoma mexicanum]|uniref:enolase-phosphatase E1-like n=1 Tax=Ambystoma mexicanum TaxID=8296 RepID=UPI0037E92799